MNSLKERFFKKVIPDWQSEFKEKNILAIPRPKKIVVNMGIGWAKDDPKLVERARTELSAICGQWPAITRARKAEASFKLKAGDPIGLVVSLRGEKLWGFFSKLIEVALPRVRDFRGLSRGAFDNSGNYNLGLTEQTIFPEIDPNKTDRVKSLGITIVMSSGSVPRSFRLLQMLGMPFQKEVNK